MSNNTTYTWEQLNRLLRGVSSEKVALRIYGQQKAVGASERWLNRIHARYRRLRLRREMREIGFAGKERIS